MSAGVKPLQVSALIKSARYLFLVSGIVYGIVKHSALKTYEVTASVKRNKMFAERRLARKNEERTKSKEQIRQLASDLGITDLTPGWEEDYI